MMASTEMCSSQQIRDYRTGLAESQTIHYKMACMSDLIHEELD